MTNDAKDGDLTPLLVAAVQMHEVLLAYIEAGFTRVEAMQVVLTIVSTSMKIGASAAVEDEPDGS